MMANTARAAVQALGRRPAVFERTPKFGLQGDRVDWLSLRYQPRLDGLVVAEVLLAGVNVWTAVEAFGRGYWAIAFYATVFATGLGFSVGLSVSQALGVRWAARGAAARVAVTVAQTARESAQ
jgi:hypothetical protein